MSAEGYAAGRHAQAYVETEKKVDIAQPPGFDDGPGAAEHPLRPAETGAGSDQRACQLVRLSVCATASPMTTWPSWPQACIVPGRCDAHPCLAGRCASTASRIGKASRSARIATVGPPNALLQFRRRSLSRVAQSATGPALAYREGTPIRPGPNTPFFSGARRRRQSSRSLPSRVQGGRVENADPRSEMAAGVGESTTFNINGRATGHLGWGADEVPVTRTPPHAVTLAAPGYSRVRPQSRCFWSA